MKNVGHISLNQWMLQHDVSPAQLLQAERRGIHLPIVDGAPGSVWVWDQASYDVLMVMHLAEIRAMPHERSPMGVFLTPDRVEDERRAESADDRAARRTEA